MARVNLKAIAHAAGVSIATASRVLSSSSYPVNDELRERVLEAARRLDYVPNAQAQGLLRGNPRSVGVLCGDLADPVTGLVVAGLHRAARDLGCTVTMFTTAGEVEAEVAALAALQSLDVGTVVIMVPGHDEATAVRRLDGKIASMLAADQQVVLIGRPGLTVDLPTVRLNDILAGRLVGEHLWSLGHRDVVVLTDAGRRGESADRVQGLRFAHGDRLRVIATDGTRAAAARAVDEAVGATAIPQAATALVGATTTLALGILTGLRDRAVAVPSQVSVVSCEDLWFTDDVEPSLTAVRLPFDELGSTALRLGLAARQGTIEQVVLPARLVSRGSTAAPTDGDGAGRGARRRRSGPAGSPAA